MGLLQHCVGILDIAAYLILYCVSTEVSVLHCSTTPCTGFTRHCPGILEMIACLNVLVRARHAYSASIVHPPCLLQGGEPELKENVRSIIRSILMLRHP